MTRFVYGPRPPRRRRNQFVPKTKVAALVAEAAQAFTFGQTAEGVLDRLAEASQGFVFGQDATATGGTIAPAAAQVGPADDRTARRKRRDREVLEAYWAARQREALEEEERKRLKALEEAQAALEQAEDAKQSKARRAAVRKVFEALNRAALTDSARQEARDAEQAALDALTARQTKAQREAYLEALDRLNEEIEAIGAQVARMYARRREEEEFLLKLWAAA